jgi:hypothetical protein
MDPMDEQINPSHSKRGVDGGRPLKGEKNIMRRIFDIREILLSIFFPVKVSSQDSAF